MPSHPHSRRRSQPRAHRKHIASPIGEARRRQGASEAATCLQAARRRRRLEAPCAAVVAIETVKRAVIPQDPAIETVKRAVIPQDQN
uniref:Uncharacterized protein n=2 Tax=Oryza TaxID=4527 RepID=A0A0E0NIJ5_ORYRU